MNIIFYYPYSLLGVKIIQTRKRHLGSGVVLLEKSDSFYLVFTFSAYGTERPQLLQERRS